MLKNTSTLYIYKDRKKKHIYFHSWVFYIYLKDLFYVKVYKYLYSTTINKNLLDPKGCEYFTPSKQLIFFVLCFLFCLCINMAANYISLVTQKWEWKRTTILIDPEILPRTQMCTCLGLVFPSYRQFDLAGELSHH